MSARIEVLSGPLAGRVIPLGAAGVSMGREAGNDLVLEDGTVSRRHAQVLPDAAGGATVRDLGSRNGITVDGKPAREGRLSHGSKFSVGRIAMRYLDEPAAPVPAEAKPAPPQRAVVEGSEAVKPALDKRFLAFLACSALVVVSVLVIWYRKTHAIPDMVSVPLKLQEEEELFWTLPDGVPEHREFLRHEVKDDNGVLEILKVYPPDAPVHRAIALRGKGQGKASIALVHGDGRRTQLEITVAGRRSPSAPFVVPPEDAADPARMERFCQVKLGEAKGIAAEGRYLKALEICRGIVGLYRQTVPKPEVAVEARKQTSQFEALLEERLQLLEETMRHKSDLKDYDGVDKTLWEMRDLVEPESAAYQRLKHLLKLNAQLKAQGQTAREER